MHAMLVLSCVKALWFFGVSFNQGRTPFPVQPHLALELFPTSSIVTVSQKRPYAACEYSSVLPFNWSCGAQVRIMPNIVTSDIRSKASTQLMHVKSSDVQAVVSNNCLRSHATCQIMGTLYQPSLKGHGGCA
eukprot:364716-Chlamydomonas_euryale.AAC.7